MAGLKETEDYMNKQIVAIMRECNRVNKTYQVFLEKLRLPLILSLMALLSSDKVNLFNENFLKLVNYILNSSGFNKTEEDAEYAGFAIEKMIMNDETLDYKRDPDVNFIHRFRYWAER